MAATIIVTLLILCAAAFALRSIIKNRKGCPSCGSGGCTGNCASCTLYREIKIKQKEQKEENDKS